MPRRRAMSAMFSGPTSRDRRAYTGLSERSVPFSIEVAPMYVWSYVWGHQAVGGLVSHEPVPLGSYLNGAERYVVIAGLMPCDTPVGRAIALNGEPGWRRADDAKLT